MRLPAPGEPFCFPLPLSISRRPEGRSKGPFKLGDGLHGYPRTAHDAYSRYVRGGHGIVLVKQHRAHRLFEERLFQKHRLLWTSTIKGSDQGSLSRTAVSSRCINAPPETRCDERERPNAKPHEVQYRAPDVRTEGRRVCSVYVSTTVPGIR